MSCVEYDTSVQKRREKLIIACLFKKCSAAVSDLQSDESYQRYHILFF